MHTELTRNGTDGRVYGGDCGLIHVADGKRADAGRSVARFVDTQMRQQAVLSGARTGDEAETQPLCPGCYMIVGFNALVTLAQQNGQPLRELAATMARAFDALANGGADAIEEINIILDSEG